MNHLRQALVVVALAGATTWGALVDLQAQSRACSAADTATVPAFVLQAASGSPADFASALSAGRVCAGLVLLSGETGRVAKVWRREPSTPLVPLGRVVSAFEASHRDYIVERIKGVLVIRARGRALSSPPLQMTTSRFVVAGISALEALRQIVATVDPAHAPRAGYIGSVITGGDEPSPSKDDIEGPAISLKLANPTLLSMLVEVSAQAPGVVWVLHVPPPSEAPPQRAEYRLSSYFVAGTTTDIGTMVVP